MAADFEVIVSMGAVTVKEKITVFFSATRISTLNTVDLRAVKADGRFLPGLLRFLEYHRFSPRRLF
jgi:hypothetical protein